MKKAKKKYQDNKKDRKKKAIIPDKQSDVNGPDDVEIGDGLTPYEKLKKKEREESCDD